VPHLEQAGAADAEVSVRSESTTLVEEIQSDGIERAWVGLQALEDGEALEKGGFLLEQMIHPDRMGRLAEAREELALIASGARQAIPPAGSLYQQITALRHYLHAACGFRGNQEDYYDPENSFLSSVLSRRTGIPISLSVIYLSVGRRIGVPLVGIGMPMHFLVGFPAGRSHRTIDPFLGGREISRGECLLLLERAGFEPPEAYLKPAPVVTILERMARNLIMIYKNDERECELSRAKRFLEILTGRQA
jgi:regulator of sirC expression with transglutaminase-like and TPR domain